MKSPNEFLQETESMYLNNDADGTETACHARGKESKALKNQNVPSMIAPVLTNDGSSVATISELNGPASKKSSAVSSHDTKAFNPIMKIPNCALAFANEFSKLTARRSTAPHCQAFENSEKEDATGSTARAAGSRGESLLREIETTTFSKTSMTTTASVSNNKNTTNTTLKQKTSFPGTSASTNMHRSYSMLQFNEMRMIHSLLNDDNESDNGISLDDSVHDRPYSFDLETEEEDLAIDKAPPKTNAVTIPAIDPLRYNTTPHETTTSPGEAQDNDDDFFFIEDQDEDTSFPSENPPSPNKGISSSSNFHSSGAPPPVLSTSSRMGMQRSLSSIQFASCSDDLTSSKTLFQSGLMMSLDPLHEHEEDDEDEKENHDEEQDDDCCDQEGHGHLQQQEETSSQVPRDEEECAEVPHKKDYSKHKRRPSWKPMKRVLSMNSLRKLKTKTYNKDGNTNSNHDRSKKENMDSNQIHSTHRKSSNSSLSSSLHDDKSDLDSLNMSLHSHRNLNLGLGLLDLSSAKVTPSPDPSYHETFYLDGDEEKDDDEPPALITSSSIAPNSHQSSHSSGRCHLSGTSKPTGIKSCMKKVSSYCNLESPNCHNGSSSVKSICSDSQSQSSNKCNNKTMKRVTSFSNIEIREYDITIGDTIPHDGPPIAIDWNYDEGQVRRFDLEYYEEMRPARRTRSEMYMGSKLRMFLLMKEQGFSPREIQRAAKNAARVRKSRTKSQKWDSFRVAFTGK